MQGVVSVQSEPGRGSEFRVDGEKVLGDPIGMKGTRLTADYLFVTALTQHAEMLRESVEDIDIEVIDRMASPLAGSYVTLTKDQKMKGCVLANIGAETVSIVVYDEGIPVSVKVFPIGSTDVTDDLALGFRVSGRPMGGEAGGPSGRTPQRVDEAGRPWRRLPGRA